MDLTKDAPTRCSPGPLTNTTPGGNTSVTVALVVATGPKLTTVIVYGTLSPIGTVALRDFVIVTSGGNKQHVAFDGVLLLLADALNRPAPHVKALPSVLNLAQVCTTVSVPTAGPLLVLLRSPGAVTVALVVRMPGTVGLMIRLRLNLPPGGMEEIKHVTT